MKTKNNVQKAVLKVLAIFITFVLISITVNAQEFWKAVLKNSGLSQIALAMSNTNNDPLTKAETSNSSDYQFEMLPFEPEKELEIEDWMMNHNIFEAFIVTEENEQPLQIEDWMTNTNNFELATENTENESLELVKNGISSSSFVVGQVTDSGLKPESWMTNPKNW